MFAFRARSSSSFSASDFRRRPIPRKPIFVERRSFLFFFSFGVWCYYIKVWYGVSRRHSKYKTLSLSNICGFWLVSLCGRFFFTHRRRFFYFFRMMKKTNTRREGTKTWEKISQKSRVKKGGTPKTDTKKTTDDLLERVALVRSIDRSIDRLLPPPSTEYTAIDKSPNLGIFFFLTRPCENARGVRVERATVVLWCLFSK